MTDDKVNLKYNSIIIKNYDNLRKELRGEPNHKYWWFRKL